VTPPNQPPTPPAAETPPLTGQPVFSKAYLEQEFPDFYSNPPSSPPKGSSKRIIQPCSYNNFSMAMASRVGPLWGSIP